MTRPGPVFIPLWASAIAKGTILGLLLICALGPR